jgi:hypothetical protein
MSAEKNEPVSVQVERVQTGVSVMTDFIATHSPLPVLTLEDRTYIHANFYTLEELCLGRTGTPAESRKLKRHTRPVSCEPEKRIEIAVASAVTTSSCV